MDLRKSFFSLLSAIAVLFLTGSFNSGFAQTAPTLGTAQGFAVLGASAVTNTGPSIVNGDLGVSPATAITGFPPGTVNGTIHSADAVAGQAQLDANTAYNALAGQPCNTILTGQDLGGLALTPGVYCFATSAQLTGTLTLNGLGNPNAVFVFKIGSTLTTASGASILLLNGATACNVFFQVGSSATLGTGTQLIGNIFALASVTLNTNANLTGRAIGLNGAVTMDSNGVSIPTCNGFVQVCKVAGAGVAVGTSFNFDVAGTPVTVAAGASPGGTCSPALTIPTGARVITETLPAGVTVTGVSTMPSAGLLISSNLATGMATVTVNPGGQTIVTFIDAATPPPPNGFIQVCKVAGSGVPVGTNFMFNVAGTLQTVAAGLSPGTCGTPISAPPGNAVVTETIPAGTVVAGISTSPSPGLLVSSNLAAGTATVTVLSGGQTIVTFIDAATPPPNTGLLQVCKVAGSGVLVATNFNFNVAGTPQSIPAGMSPNGTCGTPISVPAGNAVVTETIPVGTVVAGISTMPSAGLLVSSNLAAGTARVTVNAGGQTIVTFIDTAPPPPNNGFLQVCKVAGAGITVGTNFSFNTAGTPQIIPAGVSPGGTCGTPVAVPAGNAVVTETIPGGAVLTGVSTTPSTALLVSSNLATGTAIVTVNAGGQTIVTFIDAAISVAPINGFVQACKVAGAGIGVGSNFNFNVAGTPQTIPAGASPLGTCGAPVAAPPGAALVSETIPAGTVLADVSTLPSAGLLLSANLATGVATVTVVSGGTTIVTFIDAVTPPPNNGFLQVCKIAGAGISPGTNFVFNVAGTLQTVPAGIAPGGNCGVPVAVPAGTAMVAETVPAGTTVVGISTLPSAGLLLSSNLIAGTATVTVNAGGQTIVTFIDAIPIIGLGGGNLCINVYTFDQSEELLACCSCFVTPNGLQSMSVKQSLIMNGLTPEIPNSVVIKLVSTAGPVATSGVGGGLNTCNAGSTMSLNPALADAFQVRYAANLNVGDSVVNITNTGASSASPGALASGMRAWGTTLHALPTSPVSYGVTETPFSNSFLSQAELNHLTSFCAFIQANGSGFGICKGCSVGGLGAGTRR